MRLPCVADCIESPHSGAVRTLGLGLLFGLLASSLRAPLGVELVHVTATPASVAVAYRAVVFLLLAVALVFGRKASGEGFTPIRF